MLRKIFIAFLSLVSLVLSACASQEVPGDYSSIPVEATVVVGRQEPLQEVLITGSNTVSGEGSSLNQEIEVNFPELDVTPMADLAQNRIYPVKEDLFWYRELCNVPLKPWESSESYDLWIAPVEIYVVIICSSNISANFTVMRYLHPTTSLSDETFHTTNMPFLEEYAETISGGYLRGEVLFPSRGTSIEFNTLRFVPQALTQVVLVSDNEIFELNENPQWAPTELSDVHSHLYLYEYIPFDSGS